MVMSFMLEAGIILIPGFQAATVSPFMVTARMPQAALERTSLPDTISRYLWVLVFGAAGLPAGTWASREMMDAASRHPAASVLKAVMKQI